MSDIHMSDIYMSDPTSDDGLMLQEVTTNTNFQERLLQAQSMDAAIHQGVRFEDFNFIQDTEELKAIKSKLQEQVKRMETRVEAMEQKLALRKEKRQKEAGLTNLTPEERAAHVEEEEKRMERRRLKQEKLRKKQEMEHDLEEENTMDVSDTDEDEMDEEEEEEPDWDVVFEYMLLLGSQAADDTNHLSGTDFLQPSADIRKKALAHEDVIRQTKYSSLKILEAKNILEHNPLEDHEIRHCNLKGTCYDQKFQVTFDVLEPDMVMSNLDFQVDIEMQLDIGEVLQRVKDECHIMGFFRVLVHYATLDKQRKDVIDKLINHYRNTSIQVEALSSTRLKLEGNTNYGINLIFSWTMVPANTHKEALDANIETHIQPILTLEAVALSSVVDRDKENMLDKINDIFLTLVERQGVFNSIDYIVNKTLI